MYSVDRELLTTILSDMSGNAPARSEIVGILKQMEDETKEDLASATNGENEAIAEFENLVAVKIKEINVFTKTIESKTARVGELDVKMPLQGERP